MLFTVNFTLLIRCYSLILKTAFIPPDCDLREFSEDQLAPSYTNKHSLAP